MRRSLLIGLLLAAATAQAQDGGGPFFVYTGTFASKPAAQRHAGLHGGWVLRTDLYRGLTPGYFAVVRGPFAARADADAARDALVTDFPDAFVRAAGDPVLPRALGDAALLAAVLGDLVVDVSGGLDAGNPCAPAEPYLTVLVGFEQDEGPAAGYWLIERTGEVQPIVRCGE